MESKMILILLGVTSLATAYQLPDFKPFGSNKYDTPSDRRILCFKDETHSFEIQERCTIEFHVSNDDCNIDSLKHHGVEFADKKRLPVMPVYPNRVQGLSENRYLIQCGTARCTEETALMTQMWVAYGPGANHVSVDCAKNITDSLEEEVENKKQEIRTVSEPTTIVTVGTDPTTEYPTSESPDQTTSKEPWSTPEIDSTPGPNPTPNGPPVGPIVVPPTAGTSEEPSSTYETETTPEPDTTDYTRPTYTSIETTTSDDDTHPTDTSEPTSEAPSTYPTETTPEPTTHETTYETIPTVTTFEPTTTTESTTTETTYEPSTTNTPWRTATTPPVPQTTPPPPPTPDCELCVTLFSTIIKKLQIVPVCSTTDSSCLRRNLETVNALIKEVADWYIAGGNPCDLERYRMIKESLENWRLTLERQVDPQLVKLAEYKSKLEQIERILGQSAAAYDPVITEAREKLHEAIRLIGNSEEEPETTTKTPDEQTTYTYKTSEDWKNNDDTTSSDDFLGEELKTTEEPDYMRSLKPIVPVLPFESQTEDYERIATGSYVDNDRSSGAPGGNYAEAYTPSGEETPSINYGFASGAPRGEFEWVHASETPEEDNGVASEVPRVEVQYVSGAPHTDIDVVRNPNPEDVAASDPPSVVYGHASDAPLDISVVHQSSDTPSLEIDVVRVPDAPNVDNVQASEGPSVENFQPRSSDAPGLEINVVQVSNAPDQDFGFASEGPSAVNAVGRASDAPGLEINVVQASAAPNNEFANPPDAIGYNAEAANTNGPNDY